MPILRITAGCISTGAFQIVASKAEVRSAHIYSPEQTSGLHICDNLKCTHQHSFADPDGHQWELLYMDASALPNE